MPSLSVDAQVPRRKLCRDALHVLAIVVIPRWERKEDEAGIACGWKVGG